MGHAGSSTAQANHCRAETRPLTWRKEANSGDMVSGYLTDSRTCSRRASSGAELVVELVALTRKRSALPCAVLAHPFAAKKLAHLSPCKVRLQNPCHKTPAPCVPPSM